MKRTQSNQRCSLRWFNLVDVRPSPIRASGIGKKTAYKGFESWPSLNGVSWADCVGAVTVSVEVIEFAPGVTDVEDRAQVASGVDPITAQVI